MDTTMTQSRGTQVNWPTRRYRQYALVGALLIVVVLLLTSCGGGTREQAAGSTPSGPAAPDVSATTLEGEQFSLAQQRGKPVLLVFMAS